jgi:predicted small lipoprotein YifL
MRFSIVLLPCILLLACGKTGALYLPEEPQTQSEPPEQDTQLQSEESQSRDDGSGGTAD